MAVVNDKIIYQIKKLFNKKFTELNKMYLMVGVKS